MNEVLCVSDLALAEINFFYTTPRFNTWKYSVFFFFFFPKGTEEGLPDLLKVIDPLQYSYIHNDILP